MSLSPKYSALSFSAESEEALVEAVSKSLDGIADLNVGVKNCTAFPAVNKGFFQCELISKESKSILSRFSDGIRGRIFVDHAVIQMLYIPVILNTTHAEAELELYNLATGDKMYSGTRVSLNQAFVLTMTWPRSLFSDDVAKHKGLYLKGAITCSSSVPNGAKIGMWYPFWSEKISRKQLYQQTTAITGTLALETYARSVIRSNTEMRALMKNYASVDIAAKTAEKLVVCSDTIDLLGQDSTGCDFTVKQLPKGRVLSESLTNSDSNVDVVKDTSSGENPADVLIPSMSKLDVNANKQIACAPPKGGFLF